jgi:hypothetical protein
MKPSTPAGRRHGYRQFHDFRRLEAHESQVQPALRALADVAYGVNDQQQHDAKRKQPGRTAPQQRGFDLRHGNHGNAT